MHGRLHDRGELTTVFTSFLCMTLVECVTLVRVIKLLYFVVCNSFNIYSDLCNCDTLTSLSHDIDF